MLDFFRRYQRYFFLVITVVIIISFSFFGTYSTLGSNTWREQIAFKAINGHDVTRSDVDEMALFLATDNEDKMLYGGVWGPNFLNDGVIRKDFLETGLAQELALAYQDDLQEDIGKRMAKEKKYTLYSHPQAPFLGVESVWSYFAPQMSAYFTALQAAQNGLDPVAFNTRVNLYLAEKQLPASTLRYILRYQEKQYGDWLKPDDRLNQIDLSLFGYHTIEDWFGPHFTRLISEFIINAAILAEQQGYDVSKAEVLTDLVRNTQISYQQNQNNPNLGVTSPEEYLSEQLRRLNMDQARAIKIWRQVLLFRRYFHDAGANALVDALASQKLNHFAHENVTVDLYRLPAALKVANYQDLQNLETYLYAVTKQNKADSLALPQQFLAVEDVAKKYPELVQKRYVLEVAKVSQKALQARIGLRQLWDWEADEQNWPALIKQFPTLGVKPGKTREERFEALDSLDPTARSVVDAFAKQQIIKSHPEWITQALNEAKPETIVVGLRTQGGKMPFSGLDEKEKRQELMQLLDEAPLSSTVSPDSPLFNFSADEQVYYRIAVVERAENKEILTLEEARTDGSLDEVRTRILEQYYVANRGKDSSLYQNDKKEWKSFKEVRDVVADQYFKKVLTALEPIQKELLNGQDAQVLSKDQTATLRLYAYLNKIKEELAKNAAQAQQWVKVQPEDDKAASTTLAQRSPLADQWKIEKATLTINRQASDSGVNVTEALALAENTWSPLQTPVNGDLAFYQVKGRGDTSAQSTAVIEQARSAQALLGAEAQRHLMQQVLAELKSKNAISLAYLRIPQDETPVQQPETMEAGY
jgi:GcvH upstream region-like protein